VMSGMEGVVDPSFGLAGLRNLFIDGLETKRVTAKGLGLVFTIKLEAVRGREDCFSV